MTFKLLVLFHFFFLKGFCAIIPNPENYVQVAKRRLIFTIDDSGEVRVKSPPLKKENLNTSKAVSLKEQKHKKRLKPKRLCAKPGKTMTGSSQKMDLDYFKSRRLLCEKGGVLWAYPGFDLDYYRKENKNLDIFISKVREVLNRKRAVSWKVNEFYKTELDQWICQSKKKKNLFMADFMRHLSLLMDHKVTQKCVIKIGIKKQPERPIFLFEQGSRFPPARE